MDSFDQNNIIIAGYGKGDKKGGQARLPKESPEGIVTGALRTLSLTKVQVLDLLSEGEIQGLVSGEYAYSGTLGHVGWDSVVFTPYVSPVATGINDVSGVHWLPSIFWNETPVVDKAGKFNFQEAVVNYTIGRPNGSNLSDGIIDQTTFTRLISERLRGGGDNFAKIYRIIEKDCIGADINIRINQLSYISSGKDTLGDVQDSFVKYSIYDRPIFNDRPAGNYVLAKNETISGKVNFGYIRSSKLNFNDFSNDDGFLGWEIKISRETEDSTSSQTRNQTFIDSITEIYGSKLIYPNSALVSSTFNAEYFTNIPSRTFDTELLKVKVPSNYNPTYKTYDESNPWSGDFKIDSNGQIKKEWTDNPVWCYYDLLTNNRYGLGNYIDEDFVDKFSLYEISKYCDTLVSDGYGGLEPRFTCNLYITSQDEAYKSINSMASIFRTMTYYNAGQIYASQDSEKQPIYQFTNANVLNGDFTYSSSAKKARHTIATVRYNDKKNFYKPALEYVEDVDAIRKYGLREIDIPAYGATSRGQAIRLGRWALLTEKLETESINFRAGLEASLLRPGDIFQIYDNNKNTQRLGGRLYDITASPSNTDITLDAEITGLNSSSNYRFALLTPSFYYDSSLVTGLVSSDFSGIRNNQIQYLTFNTSNVSTISGKTNINVNTGINYTDYNVSGNLIWLIEATGDTVLGDIKSDAWENYRVINIKEVDTHIFEIEGLEYDINKFLQIESGFSFTDAVVSSNITFAYPTGLTLSTSQFSAHTKSINYSFSISDTTNIIGYRVFVKTSNFNAGDENNQDLLIANLPKDVFSGQYIPIDNGNYYFRVYSIGSNNNLSFGHADNSINIEGINPIQDITISSLRLSNITGLNDAGTISSGIYGTSSPTFSWQAGIDANSSIASEINYRITIRSPSLSNTPSSEIYFQQTGYSTDGSNYTFDFTNNYNSVSNLGKRGPFRNFDIVVEAMNSGGYSSAGGHFTDSIDSDYSNSNGYDILYVDNPQPIAKQLFTGTNTTILAGDTVPFYSTGYATQQWITQDGEIKMFFTKSGNPISLTGFFGDDLAGGTFYYSDSPFSQEEAKQQVPLNPIDKVISNVQVTSDSNPIILPLSLFNKNSQYIAMAPYDNFDVGINSFISDYLVTGIDISNVIRIKRNNAAQNYVAWVEFDVAYDASFHPTLSNNWTSKNFNIIRIGDTTIRDTLGNTYPAGEIVFEEPLESSNYAINISSYYYFPKLRLNQNQELKTSPSSVTVYHYDTDRIIIQPFNTLIKETILGNENTTGRFFIGVLQNV